MSQRLKAQAIDTLNESQMADLQALFKAEWWTRGRELAAIRRMLDHSDIIFAYCDPQSGRLVAFARVLTDRVYKALIFDVIVAESQRGTGLGRALMERIVNHPQLQSVQHFELYCLPEMVPFYEKWGFSSELGQLNFMRLTRKKESQI